MKSSTLHRSSLSRERMSMIENVKPQNYNYTSLDTDRYARLQKKPELDVLWRDFERSIQTKSRTKAPIVYAGIGFVLGLLFALGIAIIIGLSMYSEVQKPDFKEPSFKPQTNVEAPVSIVPSGNNEHTNSILEEKYTIKEGDTLDKLAFRFYGKYDQAKIDEIVRLNNIKDVTRIQIGQTLIIPIE